MLAFIYLFCFPFVFDVVVVIFGAAVLGGGCGRRFVSFVAPMQCRRALKSP